MLRKNKVASLQASLPYPMSNKDSLCSDKGLIVSMMVKISDAKCLSYFFILLGFSSLDTSFF